MSHLAKVQTIAATFLKGRALFNRISVIEAERGRIKAIFTVEEPHLNINKRLFGGFTASLIDIGGSLAIASKLESPNVGVSTDLSLSFQSSASEGDQVVILGECSKAGKNLAFTTVSLFVNDKQIAQGSHTKFMGSSSGNIKLPEI